MCGGFVLVYSATTYINHNHRFSRITKVIPMVVNLTRLSKNPSKRGCLASCGYPFLLRGLTWTNKDIQQPCQCSIICGKQVTQLALFFLRFLSPVSHPFSSIIWLTIGGMPSQKPHGMPQWFAIRCGHSIWWLEFLYLLPVSSIPPVFHPFKVN